MRIIYTISKEESEEIAKVRATVKDKQTDKRLYAVELRGRGKNNHEIAEKLDTLAKVVSYLGGIIQAWRYRSFKG